MITEVDEPAFLHGRALRISIFMNVFNVHVNRYPVAGTVKFVHYNPGKFLNAATEKSSLENEQMSVGLEHDGQRILVRQIAGLIARRIVTYSREGESVEQGERMGIIRVRLAGRRLPPHLGGAGGEGGTDDLCRHHPHRPPGSALTVARTQPRRAVVLLPNGFTLANLFFGVFAIVAASRGDFSQRCRTSSRRRGRRPRWPGRARHQEREPVR